MQTFKDTATGRFFQFDDDVVVSGEDGAREFHGPNGDALFVPATLVPATFVAPEPQVFVPAVVSRFQGREAMHQTPHGDGSLFEAAEAVLAHPDTPAMYRRAWDDLQEFLRDSEMLNAVAAALELDSNDLDALFILAGSIKA